MSEVNISKLQNAFENFLEMYEYYKNIKNKKNENDLILESAKESVVQRFEYTQELFWKILKRYMEEYLGVEAIQASKDVYRKAGELNILDTEQWFKFVSARNLASHTYNEKNLEEVLSVMDDFAEHGKHVLKYLEDNINNE